jgi:hypothetical protein
MPPQMTLRLRVSVYNSTAEVSTMSDTNGKPQSLDQPWWLGKAKRQHVLVKFVVVCAVIAMLILGLALIAAR